MRMLEDGMVPFPRELLERMGRLQEMADNINAHRGSAEDDGDD